MPLRLDQDLLDELEARWREQGAFVGRALRPALTDDEMDRLTVPVGIRLPDEARRWWGWHDGAGPQPPGPAAELGPGRAFLPLALAVKECQRLRDVMRATWGPELGPDWKEGWLPIDAEKAPISLDCSVTATAVVPVRTFFMEDPSFAADGVASIGELVLMWIAAIDCGAWWYDQDADAWACDRAKLDARLMASELA